MHNDVTKEQNVLSCYSNCFILRQATMLTEAFNQIKCAIKCVFFLWEMKTFFIWFWRQKKTKKKRIQNKSIALELKIIPNRIITRYFFVFFFTRRMKKRRTKFGPFDRIFSILSDFLCSSECDPSLMRRCLYRISKFCRVFNSKKSKQMADMHWV